MSLNILFFIKLLNLQRPASIRYTAMATLLSQASLLPHYLMHMRSTRLPSIRIAGSRNFDLDEFRAMHIAHGTIVPVVIIIFPPLGDVFISLKTTTPREVNAVRSHAY